MGRIIVIANQKGGVGKTTTAINLSAYIAIKKKRVLLIDMDPQGNASGGFDIDPSSVTKTVYDVMLGEASIEDAIISNVRPKLSIVPSDVNLAAAEIQLSDVADKNHILKKELGKIRDKYDYIIMDCPPSLNILTINAMCAADSVIVPLQCEYYALEGLAQLMQTVSLIQERENDRKGKNRQIKRSISVLFREMSGWRRLQAMECRSRSMIRSLPERRPMKNLRRK